MTLNIMFSVVNKYFMGDTMGVFLGRGMLKWNEAYRFDVAWTYYGHGKWHEDLWDLRGN